MADANENEVEYYSRTYSLKSRDGIYAWMYDDGRERFPNLTFQTEEEAIQFIKKIHAGQYSKFEPKS